LERFEDLCPTGLQQNEKVMTMKELLLALLSDTTILSVVIGGLFSFLGVVIGWGLNEVSATRRAKPKLCFRLNSTPDSELVEAELRTKTSASEYSIDIFNVGQSPVIIESFDMYWRKQLLIQCFPSSEDATILPYHNISYVLTQQDADAIERHCKRLGFKQCRIVTTTVNGEKFKENIDVSWIHMRTSLWEEP